MKNVVYYSKSEERLNVLSHGLGFILSIVALVFLIIRACQSGSAYNIVSFTIFGVSLAILYAASTSYHYVQNSKIRARLNVFDHSAIYILIAGTYTPFALVTLNGWVGWTIFGVVWGLALIGVIFKLKFTGRFDKLSTITYVLMGWMIILAIIPLTTQLSTYGLLWLLVGGLSYTVGAIFYRCRSLNYNHAIFHVFVLLGSISHFLSIYIYV